MYKIVANTIPNPYHSVFFSLMSSREHTHTHTHPRTPGHFFQMNRHVCLVRLGTEQVFIEKDITSYDLDSARIPTWFCSLNIVVSLTYISS